MTALRRIKTLVLMATLLPLLASAQGWPAQYGGVMLQGFYWNSNFFDKATMYPSSYTESDGNSWYSIPNGEYGWNHALDSDNAWREWSAPNTRWATLTANIDQIAPYFDVMWVPQSGANTAPKDYVAYPGQPNPDCMGFVPVYWFNHGKTDSSGNYYTATWHAPMQDTSTPTYWDTEESAEIKSWFGTEAELRTMIAAYKAQGTAVIEDVILNHKGGIDYWSNGWFANLSTDADKISNYNANYKAMSYNFPWETSPNPDATWTQGDYDITWSSKDIVNIDELFSSPIASWFSASDKGAGDTADNGGWARDLDHTSDHVQYNINKYLDFLLEDIGYGGLRIDYVKGFSGTYMGMFLGNHAPTYAVGECYDGNATGTVIPWIQSTYRNGYYQSAAFDFPLKLNGINPAFNNGDWGALNDCVALINKENDTQWRRYSVTFVDNHDTFKHLPHDITNYRDRCSNRIMGANAFILAMPGTPCVFYPHYMNPAWQPTMQLFIKARRAAGITNQSGVFGDSDNSTANGCAWRVIGDHGSLLFECGGKASSALRTGFTQLWSSDDCRLSIALMNEDRTGVIADPISVVNATTKQNVVNGYPIIDKPSGHYQGSVDVTIKPNNSYVKIVYTVDGTEPSAYGRALPAGGTTITVGSNMTIKAGVLVDGEVPASTVITRRYIVDANAADESRVYVYNNSGWTDGKPYLYAWDATDASNIYTSAYPGWQYNYTATVGGLNWLHCTVPSTNYKAIINWGNDTKTPDLGEYTSDVFLVYEYGGTGVKDVTNAYIDMVHYPTVAIDKGSGSYVGNLTIQLDASNPDDNIVYVVNKAGEAEQTLTTTSNACQRQQQVTLTAPGDYTVQAAMVKGSKLVNKTSRVYHLTTASIKIYVRNMTTNEAPNIHYWSVSGYSEPTWPGEALNTTETVAGQTWYVKEFSGASSANFLFDLSSDTSTDYVNSKTGNISVSAAGEYFYYYFPGAMLQEWYSGKGCTNYGYLDVTGSQYRSTTIPVVTFKLKKQWGLAHVWENGGTNLLGSWSASQPNINDLPTDENGYAYMTFINPSAGKIGLILHNEYSDQVEIYNNVSSGSAISGPVTITAASWDYWSTGTVTGPTSNGNTTTPYVSSTAINIYVKTKDDVQPNGYFWNGDGDQNGSWPGTQMTAVEIDGDTWYKWSTNTAASVNAIFNLGNGNNQSEDINSIGAGDHYYYWNTTNYDASTNAVTVWDVTNPVPSVATVQVGKQYVYFVNELDWEAPMIYSFTEVGGASDEVNGAWPGQLLDEPVGISPDGHAIYLIEFDGHVPEKLIFSNNGDNGTQTGDIENVNAGYFTNASGGYLVGIARGAAHSTGDDTLIEYTTWTLAQILKYGTVGDYYIVANDVTVGYNHSSGNVYIKDTNAEGINPQFPSEAQRANNNQYVYDWVYKGNAELNFDQSNWAKLVPKSGTSFNFTQGHFIQGGTILCQFTDAVNPTLEIVSDIQPVEGDADPTLFMNEYCPANFVQHNETPVPWFFMTPTISEYCKIKWAVYDGVEDGKATFYVPATTGEGGMNQYNIGGRLQIAVDERADQEAFKPGYSYNMTCIINNSGSTLPGREAGNGGNAAPRRVVDVNKDNQTQNGTNLILLTAETSEAITGVDDVNAQREVVGVRYFNLQGMTSVEPFDGVNIVITTYSDGTTQTKKVLY